MFTAFHENTWFFPPANSDAFWTFHKPWQPTGGLKRRRSQDLAGRLTGRVTKLAAVSLPPATSQSHYTEPVHRTAVRRMLWPTGNNHLPLEALPLVLNNVKVLQVQVNVVAPVAASRGHVPHHGEGQVTQNGWRRCGRHRRRGAVGGAWTGGGGM